MPTCITEALRLVSNVRTAGLWTFTTKLLANTTFFNKIATYMQNIASGVSTYVYMRLCDVLYYIATPQLAPLETISSS